MAILRTQSLDERIRNIRADIDAVIDARVAAIMKECPGIPDGVIRNSITRGMGCQCSTYLELKAKDEEQKAKDEEQKGAA